jgi:hypothetical protein
VETTRNIKKAKRQMINSFGKCIIAKNIEIVSYMSKVTSTTNLFEREFASDLKNGILFYIPVGSEVSESELLRIQEDIIKANTDISLLYPGIEVLQQIVLCPLEFYKERFKKKAKANGYDPAPWIEWSEGDIDTVNNIDLLFCLNIDAKFESEGDRRRFYIHELAHPYAAKLSPVYDSWRQMIQSDCEGLVEADARIIFQLQKRDDMKYSTQFIRQIESSHLALSSEIEKQHLGHPSFINKTVSINPGYASCFLWFLGMALYIDSQFMKSIDLRDHYMKGREILLDIAKRSQTKEEYKELLKKEKGFDYDKEASNIAFLLNAREHFLSYY